MIYQVMLGHMLEFLLKFQKIRRKPLTIFNIGPKINDDMDKNLENFELDIFFIISIYFFVLNIP